MAAILAVVDAWGELARQSAPDRFDTEERMELLGQLVRLVSRRLRGFRRPPKSGAVVALTDAVGMRIRSSHIPADTDAIERELQAFGFRVEVAPGSYGREVVVRCMSLAGARVIPFPQAQRAAKPARQR